MNVEFNLIESCLTRSYFTWLVFLIVLQQAENRLTSNEQMNDIYCHYTQVQ